MDFPLSQLPLELAFEILRLAASPNIQCHSQSPVPLYQNAIALALVSHNVRQVIMPHFLQTVIFSTQGTINLFIRTIEQQQHLATTRSRLRLDYSRLVRHLWSTRCWEPLIQSTDYPKSYRLLHNIYRNAETIGFNFNSLHLLYEILGGTHSLGESLPPWNCKRVTLAGEGLRWNPITSTSAGLSFLKHLTHLTMWSPVNDHIGRPSPLGGVPNWVYRVPFELMPNLTHFAFSLISAPGASKMAILNYTYPQDPYSSNKNSPIFRQWAASPNPLERGSLFHMDMQHSPLWKPTPETRWETAYLQGANDIWPDSDHCMEYELPQVAN